MTYTRFFLMILSSTVLMYALTYLNSWEIGHVHVSETRIYMALLMGAMMAVVMMGFMWPMYRGRAAKLSIFAGAAVVFVASLYLVRSQTRVDDVSYMRAMIPHHSIAILTSERAQISDPRVAELAQGIIETQLREIDEMNALIADLDR